MNKCEFNLSSEEEGCDESDMFDDKQQIARAAFADMLHDSDRNFKYHQALKKTISKVHAEGKKAIVLDIGTGTGILSMMAARCGADEIYACEMFGPMSKCAENIIAVNKLEKKIKVIHKESCQVNVGSNGDMPYRANILVAEVLDTELIGEGAIRTYLHAQRELMEENSYYIPSTARIYAAVFSSNFVNAFNKIQDVQNVLRIPPKINDCAGSAAVHDIQLSYLPEASFKLLTNPQVVLWY